MSLRDWGQTDNTNTYKYIYTGALTNTFTLFNLVFLKITSLILFQ